MKVLAVFLIVLALAGLLAVFAVVQPFAGEGPRWDGPRAEAGRLEQTVRALATLGPRHDQAGMAKAAWYLAAQMVTLGLSPEVQDYPFANGTYRNLIVKLGPDVPERVVIGAHYDARGPFPGADDNASGTAGLLELARMFKAHPPPIGVDLVFYPREEVDGQGSAAHAATVDPQRIKAMISLEMIGCFSEPQKFPFAVLKWLYPAQGDYIVVVGRPKDIPLVRKVKRGIAGAGLRVQSIDAPEAVPGIGNSDHRNYWKRGITAAMVTDTAWYRNPRYHTAQDTPDTLDYARMALVVDGVAAAISGFPR
jgi:hypothetical protein